MSLRRRVSAPVPRLHQGAVTAGDSALLLACLISNRGTALAKSLTKSRLLYQIGGGNGPDQCSVSRAFSCVVQLLWVFLRHVSLLAQVLDLRRPRINRVGHDKEENATHVGIANLVENGQNEEK